MSEDDRLEQLVEEARAARKIAQTALQEKAALESKVDDIVDEITELKETNERLTYRVAELEAEQPDSSTEYESLSLDEKVARVREELMIHANASMTGCAEFDYRDVMVSVFGDKPGANHTYKLMRLAGEKEGFNFEDPANGNRRVTVDLQAVKDAGSLSGRNKDVSEGGV